MMRNYSSDIFCLKEPKYGENDGSKLFSVKGVCSAKINRRRQFTNDVFQDISQRTLDKEDATDGKGSSNDETEALTQDSEIGDRVDELPEASSETKENSELGKVDVISETFDGTQEGSPAIETDIDVSLGPAVSYSQIRRNPVTGDGLEDDKKNSKKHFERKPGICLW